MHDETTTKEKILKRVRKALLEKTTKSVDIELDSESDVFQTPTEALEIIFAQHLTKLNGHFIYCEDEKELCNNIAGLISEKNWKDIYSFEETVGTILTKANINFSKNKSTISKANVGVSFCEFLVARTGSVLVSSKQNSGRRLSAFANYHIVIAYTSQLTYTVKEALQKIKNKYDVYPSMIITISGPSRTADIEKTLVQGAHGPKEIYVFLVAD